VTLDTDIEATSRRLSEQTAERADRLLIRNKFIWEYARRSMAQRLRNDKREQRKWKSR
jgi:hypothetical protein